MRSTEIKYDHEQEENAITARVYKMMLRKADRYELTNQQIVEIKRWLVKNGYENTA